MKNINGAGVDPSVDDVPERFSDCIKCGAETVEKLIGDEVYIMCSECGYVQH